MNKPEKLPAVGDLIEILRGDGSRGQVRPVTSTFECYMFLLEGIVRPFHILNEDLSWRRAGVVPAWDPKTGPLGDVSLGFIRNLKAGDREKLAMRMGLPFDAEPEAIWRAMMLDAAKGTAFDPAVCGSMAPSAAGQIHISFCQLPSKHEGSHAWTEEPSGSNPAEGPKKWPPATVEAVREGLGTFVCKTETGHTQDGRGLGPAASPAEMSSRRAKAKERPAAAAPACHALAPTGYACCQLPKGHAGDHSAEFRWPATQNSAGRRRRRKRE